MALRIKRQLAPQRAINTRTSGTGNPKRYVTIHQTGNTSPGADAQAHANIQSRVNPRQASWHWQVDDKIAIQSFDDSIKCWHAGDGNGPGNTQSIGIEICINSDGDYRKAVENGAELARILLDKYGLGVEDLRQHHDWSRKNCPAQIRANKDGISWSDFKRMVSGKKPSKPAAKPKPSSKKYHSIVDYLKAHGMDSSVNNRKRLAAKYGIKNYRGTAEQNIMLLNKLQGGSSGSSKPSKPKSFKPGQKVNVKKSASKFATGEPIADFVKGNSYKIKQVKSDRLLLDGIMSWVHKKDVY
ncbi:N-acetylmuramoyl-L-alanine amidase [Cerasibacillus sp. JNUCC 74]